RVRNRRQLNSLQNTWPYGYSMPIAVRYTQDAFSRSGWLWPVDAKGEPLKATSYMAVGFYVAKYVNKKSDMDWRLRTRRPKLGSTLPVGSVRIKCTAWKGTGPLLVPSPANQNYYSKRRGK